MHLLVDYQAAGSRRIPSSLVGRLPLLHLLQEAPPLPHLLHVGEWFTLVAPPHERLVGLPCLFSRSIDRVTHTCLLMDTRAAHPTPLWSASTSRVTPTRMKTTTCFTSLHQKEMTGVSSMGERNDGVWSPTCGSFKTRI
jgi:hypothetical protein